MNANTLLPVLGSRTQGDLLALLCLNREFSGIEGIDFAYIFGSWAARYKGVPGPISVDAGMDNERGYILENYSGEPDGAINAG